MNDAVMTPRNVPAVSEGSTPINVAREMCDDTPVSAKLGVTKKTSTSHNAIAALNTKRGSGAVVSCDILCGDENDT